jgi:hypothetical protein
MGSSGSTPPQYPGLSAQERDLLEKQGMSLDQFNSILSQENISAQENQNLLRQLSGLYSEQDVAASPGTPSIGNDVWAALDEVRANKGNISVEKAGLQFGKPISDSSKAILAKLALVNGGLRVDEWRAQLQADPQIGVKAGVATMQGATQAGKKYALNQAAVDDLRKRVAAGQATQQELTDLEQGIYKTGLESLKSQLPQITELNQLQLERQKRALEGTLPVSQGLLDRKTKDFVDLKEAAARRGIFIEGDSPETATSQSSAGNELAGQFKRTYGLLEDQERRGEITGAPNQVYTPGPASQNPYGQQLGYATAGGSGGLLGAYGQLANSYGAAAAPYGQANMNAYQGLLNSYSQGMANTRGNYQLGGQVLGGILGMYGGPAGSAAGATAGGTLMGSGSTNFVA